MSTLSASESPGLQKLTEYLNQTRRQAEIAIDTLNNRIAEMEDMNAALSKSNDDLTSEMEYYKSLVEQLKMDGTRKSRLQERDDWKSLVDSMQKDRVRLQEEVISLKQALEDAQAELAGVAEQNQLLSESLSQQQLLPPGVNGGPLNSNSTDRTEMNGTESSNNASMNEAIAMSAFGAIRPDLRVDTSSVGSGVPSSNSSNETINNNPSNTIISTGGAGLVPGSPLAASRSRAPTPLLVPGSPSQQFASVDQLRKELQKKNSEIMAFQEENSRLRVELESLRIAVQHGGDERDLDNNGSLSLSSSSSSSSALTTRGSDGAAGSAGGSDITSAAPYVGLFNLWGLFSAAEAQPAPSSRIIRV